MFEEKIKSYSVLIDNALKSLFLPNGVTPKHLQEVMSSSVMAGGKRLRPALLLETCRMLGGDVDSAIPFACAIELIHSYSLIHDDLPCLDNDDLRRGKPTSHKMFDEARALLAGDALLSYAFEIMLAEIEVKNDLRYIHAANAIALAAGTKGMVAGQWQDVLSEGKAISVDELKYIHQHKTADMICGAIKAGAYIAGADECKVKQLSDYGNIIGITFQISDDILDVEGNVELLGKNIGSDSEGNKATYVSIYGIDKAKEIEKQLTNQACEIALKFNDADFFVELANYIIERDR